jgi:hypothetical protein
MNRLASPKLELSWVYGLFFFWLLDFFEFKRFCFWCGKSVKSAKPTQVFLARA